MFIIMKNLAILSVCLVLSFILESSIPLVLFSILRESSTLFKREFSLESYLKILRIPAVIIDHHKKVTGNSQAHEFFDSNSPEHLKYALNGIDGLWEGIFSQDSQTYFIYGQKKFVLNSVLWKKKVLVTFQCITSAVESIGLSQNSDHKLLVSISSSVSELNGVLKKAASGLEELYLPVQTKDYTEQIKSCISGLEVLESLSADNTYGLHKPLQMVKTGTSKVISETLGKFRAFADSLGIDLVCEVNSDVPQKLFTYKNRLIKVLCTLLVNSLQKNYSGFIKVKLTLERFNLIRVSLVETVRNYSESRMKGVFVETANKLLESIGSRIEYSDTELSTFSFVFPFKGTLSRVGVLDETTEVEDEHADLTPPRYFPTNLAIETSVVSKDFLVVTSSLISKTTIERILSIENCSFGFAQSFMDGIELLRKADRNYLILVLDADLEGISPLKAIKQIQSMLALGEIKHLPRIVAFGKKVPRETKREMLDLGVLGFIEKPLRYKNFSTVVYKSLRDTIIQ